MCYYGNDYNIFHKNKKINLITHVFENTSFFIILLNNFQEVIYHGNIFLCYNQVIFIDLSSIKY